MRPLTFAGVYSFKQKYFQQAMEGLVETHQGNPSNSTNFDIKYSEPGQSEDDTFVISTSAKCLQKSDFEERLKTRWYQYSVPFNIVKHSGGQELIPFNFDAVVEKLMSRPKWVKTSSESPGNPARSSIHEMPAEVIHELPEESVPR